MMAAKKHTMRKKGTKRILEAARWGTALYLQHMRRRFRPQMAPISQISEKKQVLSGLFHKARCFLMQKLPQISKYPTRSDLIRPNFFSGGRKGPQIPRVGQVNANG